MQVGISCAGRSVLTDCILWDFCASVLLQRWESQGGEDALTGIRDPEVVAVPPAVENGKYITVYI